MIASVLIVFVLVVTLLKLSFLRFWQMCLMGVLCGAWVLVSCRWAVLQSKTCLNGLLTNTARLQDGAVLVTVEGALFCAFCFWSLKQNGEFHLEERKKFWHSLLQFYPGLLIFPALFWLQTQLIFALSGVVFDNIVGAGGGLFCRNSLAELRYSQTAVRARTSP